MPDLISYLVQLQSTGRSLGSLAHVGDASGQRLITCTFFARRTAGGSFFRTNACRQSYADAIYNSHLIYPGVLSGMQIEGTFGIG